jgi:hypothetical protein
VLSPSSWIVSYLIFRPLIQFKLIFLCVRKGIKLPSSTCEYPVSLAPFIEKAVQKCVLGTFIEGQLAVNVWDHSWISILFLCPCISFMPANAVLITMTL